MILEGKAHEGSVLSIDRATDEATGEAHLTVTTGELSET